MKLLCKEEIRAVFEIFCKNCALPQTELCAPNPFCLLVAVVLSAQATDKSVNRATKDLFKIAYTPQLMAELGEEKLIPYIKSIGLYKNKASHVIALSKLLIEKYGQKAGALPFDKILADSFPSTREEFMALPGVGRKTANVMLNVLYHKATMPVDTHILRIAPRIGLSSGTTPLQIEEELMAKIPDEFLEHAHHWLILHGRYVCTARKPLCETCILKNVCAKNL